MFVSQILRNVSESFVVHIWLLTQPPPPHIMPRTSTTYIYIYIGLYVGGKLEQPIRLIHLNHLGELCFESPVGIGALKVYSNHFIHPETAA